MFDSNLIQNDLIYQTGRSEKMKSETDAQHPAGITIVDSSVRSVRSAYQPPANSTFLSEQTSHQQPASSTFLSAQTSTSHQPPAKRTGW
jgi:hypothetical protein